MIRHNDLTHHAHRFLQRKGCVVIAAGVRSWESEIPDVIGFETGGRSHVVEIKVSRRDFMADTKKQYRLFSCGMGQRRWYFAPPGVISIDKLPKDCGLVEFHGSTYSVVADAPHRDGDIARERTLMIRLIRGVEDPIYRNKHSLYIKRLEVKGNEND